MPDLTATTEDGVRLTVTVEGSGPPLVMIPGLGSSRHVYRPLVPLLAETRTVVVYDPRGIGGSELGDQPSSMALLARDCVSVIDAAGFDRVALWGASMGGMVAEQVAIDAGERLSALVLAATTPGGAQAVPAAAEQRRALLGGDARTPEQAYRTACTVLYAPDFQELHANFIDSEVSHRARHPVSPRAFSAQRSAAARHDCWEGLGRLRLPTLVLHGTDDHVQPIANAVLLAQRIPGARHQWFEGRGHLFFHEVPVETVRTVEAFLEAVEARG